MTLFRVKNGKFHKPTKVAKGTGKQRIKTYYPGDTFEAEAHRMVHFMDILEAVNPTELAAELKPPEELNPMTVVPRPGAPGWFDVINSKTGETLNERGLRRQEAEAMVDGGYTDDQDRAPEDSVGEGKEA